MRSAACECRRSWKSHGEPTLAATAGSQARFLKLLRHSPPPFARQPDERSASSSSSWLTSLATASSGKESKALSKRKSRRHEPHITARMCAMLGHSAWSSCSRNHQSAVPGWLLAFAHEGVGGLKSGLGGAEAGITWVKSTSGLGHPSTYSDELAFVIVYGSVRVSEDGRAWRTVGIPNDQLSGVVFLDASGDRLLVGDGVREDEVPRFGCGYLSDRRAGHDLLV